MTIDLVIKKVAEIVQTVSGNILGKDQRSMMENRISKRMLDLGGLTPEAYLKHLELNLNSETEVLVSLLTTHHTFFFREYSHFEYIIKNFESIAKRAMERSDKCINIWSAACSRGQEAYSLAMVIESLIKRYPGLNYKIWASDIDPESVKYAKNGVYPWGEVKSIPANYLSGNWQRGTGDIAHFAKIKDHLKKRCEFFSMNLLDQYAYKALPTQDIIFCRNVFIYFDKSTILKIVESFKQKLDPDGVLITGLSESLINLEIDKKALQASVYSFNTKKVEKSVEIPVVEKKRKIRMLVVDDSASVLKLLSRIFEQDDDFELVGTAADGILAQEFLKKNTVDAMTLDIHMPNLDGVSYLKNNFHPKHPKVVMVSSASREDTQFAQKALAFGASDFVEKPALNNLTERAEEIKIKIKMSLAQDKIPLEIDESFKNDFKLARPDEALVVYVANISDIKRMSMLIKSWAKPLPAMVILFEGNAPHMPLIQSRFLEEHLSVQEFNQELKASHLYIADLATSFSKIKDFANDRTVTVGVFGACSKKAASKLLELENAHLLIEDTEGVLPDLKEVASDIFPATSFPHLGLEYLAKQELNKKGKKAA